MTLTVDLTYLFHRFVVFESPGRSVFIARYRPDIAT